MGIVAVLVTLSLFAASRSAQAAPDGDASLREAAKHFQQGVTFYGESDYKSALVEFRRAATIAPSSAALYNIAETEYQLRDYAGAIRTFERYLSAVGPNDAHRAEVESDIKLLRARVGRLNIATIPVGADITVDDQHVGKTPFAQPLVVNVGRLKVAATAEGHLSMTQYVDVAADDNVAVSLELARPTLPQEPVSLELSAPASGSVLDSRHQRSSLRRAGWIGAGVAAAGALTFALLANKASSDLQEARRSYLMNSDRLNELASRTTRYAVLTDVFAVTAIAVAAWTFFSSTDNTRGGSSAGLRLGPTSAALQAIF
jgi:tetratricopeptide (TPR) repeat protein